MGGITMNMNKSQKKSEKGMNNRIVEYLELKYDTDTRQGLTLAKVRQRSHKHYKNSITKEKKRIWFACLKQECQNPLFFFFLYLCMVSVLFQFDQRVKNVLVLSCMVFLFWKVEKTFRYRKVLFKQEEVYSPKAVVLRENIFQCVQVNSLVKGDIIRLKKGEKVPCAVISLKSPYKLYEQEEIFAENTGRAIVTQQVPQYFLEAETENRNIEKNKNMRKNEIVRGKKQENLYATEEKEIEEYRENYKENIILQELFIRQGIYFRPRFFEKGIIRENRPIVAVGFEETYFPSKFQIEKFQRFIQELKKTDVKWFFFTSESREEAFSIGKQTGIVEEKREVIDRKQFLLLKNIAIEKQIGSIRIYCGLSESEKKQVIVMWRNHQQAYPEGFVQNQGRILFMSGLDQSEREKITERCVYACCDGGSQVNDIWFKKNWRDTMVKYLTGETIWRKFFRHAKKWEKQILASLCIFMFLSILLSLYMPQQGNMRKIMQIGSLFCAVYIIGREIVEEVFRKWFLRRLNNS